MTESTSSRLTSVYQYFDARGQLLYVGVTARGVRRAVEHAESKEWWPHATTCALEHYESRTLALRREELLIKRYCPPFNTVHNSKKQEARRQLKPTTPTIYSDVDADVTKQVPVRSGAASAELDAAVELVLAAGVPIKQRRQAWYDLPRRLKRAVPCLHCGLRPGDRGPECRPCLTASQAEREAESARAS